jgi:copper chaperone CopZ
MSRSNPATTLLTLLGLLAAGCQSGGAPRASETASSAPAATSAGEASLTTIALTDPAPLKSDSATLTVGGLGCPLCANNIENKLGGMTGVQSVSVDLSTGKVKVGFWGKDKPSPMALAQAVRDSGFTPTQIQTP